MTPHVLISTDTGKAICLKSDKPKVFLSQSYLVLENWEETVNSYFAILYFSWVKNLLNLEADSHLETKHIFLSGNNVLNVPAFSKVLG